MMRAARFHEYGSAEVMQVDDVPTPEPGSGEVRIRVRACALNHVDIDIRDGVSRLPVSLPHTLGFELAGDVDAIGSDVAGISIGDRVMPLYQMHCRNCDWCARGQHMHCERIEMFGIQLPGGYAEYVIAPAWTVIQLGSGLSYEAAAATQTAFATGWHALTKRAQVKEGDWVLVNAAASGVGSAAIQLVRLLGGRVIASASSDEKLARAHELGAEAGVNYATEDLTARVRAITDGRGVDIVYESVGGELLEASIPAMSELGELVLVGAHAGEVVPVDFIELFRHQWTLHGSARANEEELRHVVALAADGRIQPVVSERFPLERVQDAHRMMESRKFYGKIILEP